MRRIIKPFIMIILVTIIMMLSILSLGINVNRENMSLYAEGVENMNSGQTKLLDKVRDDLQYPNIYLNEEIDWEIKLNVIPSQTNSSSWDMITWWDIIDSISARYERANIIVSGDALFKLRDSTQVLLPAYLDIYTQLDKNTFVSSSLLVIKLRGSKVYQQSYPGGDILDRLSYKIGLDFFYSYTNEGAYEFSFNSQNLTEFTLPQEIQYNWVSNKPISILLKNQPEGYGIEKYKVVYSPRFDDKLELQIVILNLPLLNPVSQGVLNIVETTSVIRGETFNYHTYVNFTHFLSGKDEATNDEYRIVYNGRVRFDFIDNLDGTHDLIPSATDNKLWIQLYVKSPTDTFYTMSHREELLGNDNCYVGTIRKLDN